MGSKIIRSPVPGGYVMVSGVVVRLRLGQRRIKCLIQDEPNFLLDYRTGFRFPSVHGARLELRTERALVWRYHGMSERQVAQAQLDELVAVHGEEAIFKVLDGTPTLNEE